MAFRETRVFAILHVLYSQARYVRSVLERRSIFRFFRSFDLEWGSSGTSIAFNLVRNYNFRPLLFECFLALKVAERGARPVILVDDGVLPQHDVRQGNFTRFRYGFREWFMARVLHGVPFMRYYSEFLSAEDRREAVRRANRMIGEGDFTVGGVSLWPSIESSLIKYYRSAAGFLEEEANYEHMLREFTQTALLSYQLAVAVDREIMPHAVVMYHGIYAAWGPFYSYFDQKNTRTIVYKLSGQKQNSVKYAHRGADDFFAEMREEIDLDEAEAAASKIMERRFAFRTRDLTRYGRFGEDRALLNTLKDAISGTRTFALFTNVLWDASLTRGNPIFFGPVDWLQSTINYFKDASDKTLIIRAHPAESSTMPARVSVREIVSRIIGRRIPENEITVAGSIIFIPSSIKMKSYALFDMIAGGIVYNGTIGLEMMYAGLPVIIAGPAPYLQTSFATRLATKDEYFRAIDIPEAMRGRQEVHRADLLKFIFFYFDLREMPLHHFGTSRDLHDQTDAILQDETLSKIAHDVIGEPHV